MNIVVIYGAEHKGSTYNIAQLLIKDLGSQTDSLKEFFLPKDMPYFCCGCTACFMKGEQNCPHCNEINPIREAMFNADLLIFASPVYVLHVTGQMKAFLDHFGYLYMVHRPNKKMFSKMAVVISTAAGAGMKSTNKDITDSLYFWGVGRIFTFGKAVRAINCQGVGDKDKVGIEKEIKKSSGKISKLVNRVTPNLKIKAIFYMSRFLHKKINMNKIDKDYWQDKGWLGSARPWHK